MREYKVKYPLHKLLPDLLAKNEHHIVLWEANLRINERGENLMIKGTAKTFAKFDPALPRDYGTFILRNRTDPLDTWQQYWHRRSSGDRLLLGAFCTIARDFAPSPCAFERNESMNRNASLTLKRFLEANSTFHAWLPYIPDLTPPHLYLDVHDRPRVHYYFP